MGHPWPPPMPKVPGNDTFPPGIETFQFHVQGWVSRRNGKRRTAPGAEERAADPEGGLRTGKARGLLIWRGAASA